MPAQVFTNPSYVCAGHVSCASSKLSWLVNSAALQSQMHEKMLNLYA